MKRKLKIPFSHTLVGFFGYIAITYTFMAALLAVWIIVVYGDMNDPNQLAAAIEGDPAIVLWNMVLITVASFATAYYVSSKCKGNVYLGISPFILLLTVHAIATTMAQADYSVQFAALKVTLIVIASLGAARVVEMLNVRSHRKVFKRTHYHPVEQ